LRSQDKLLPFTLVSLLQSVVAEVTSLLLVALVQPSATMFVLGQLAVQIAAAVLALVFGRPAALRWADRRPLVAALAYALPLIPATLSTFVLNSADRLLVSGALGSTAVARYQIAYNIGALPMMLVGILSTSWMPRIFSVEQREERSAVQAAGRDILLSLLVPVVIGLSVGAPLVLHVWAPAQYRPDDLLLVTAVVVISVLPYTGKFSTEVAAPLLERIDAELRGIHVPATRADP
jgi:O-antigen/teichoic acid export membrane protein